MHCNPKNHDLKNGRVVRALAQLCSRSAILSWAVIGCLLAISASAAAADDFLPKQRRVWAADYSTKRLALADADGTLVWETPIQDIHDFWVLPDGNLLFQTSWTQLVEMNRDKKIVWQYDAAKPNRGPVGSSRSTATARSITRSSCTSTSPTRTATRGWSAGWRTGITSSPTKETRPSANTTPRAKSSGNTT